MRPYFLSYIVWNVDLMNIDRHGSVANVDRLRMASILTYDFICHDVLFFYHGILFLSFLFILVASDISYRDSCWYVFLDF